jgi:hypothetical protein
MSIFGPGKKSALNIKARMLLGDGDPVAEALHGAAGRRDWETVRGTLGRFEGQDRTELVWALAWDQPEVYQWLRKEPELDENDAVARMLLGVVTVAYGWSVRSGLLARHVSREQFEGFHALLREAEPHLYAAAELDPGWSGPWVGLLASGRGLQVGLDVIRRRFEAAVTRNPADRIAHTQMLLALCKKWFGSHELMHEFADQARRGTHGADLAYLTARAHLEQALSFGHGDERRAYLAQPRVRSELAEAAELSVFRPGYTLPRTPYDDANLFAMVFSLAGMRAEARRAFELTEGVVTRVPWEQISRDVMTVYTTRRRQVRTAK